jgi:hypothetical protein
MQTEKFKISLDLEFIGPDPIRNQIVQIGAALKNAAVVTKGGQSGSQSGSQSTIKSFKIGPIRIEKDRVWDKNCRLFWESQSSMKPILDTLDKSQNLVSRKLTFDESNESKELQTISLKEAIDSFVVKIDEWANEYGFSRMSRERTEEKFDSWKRNNVDVSWLVDTGSVDVSHMNAALCSHGYPPMHYYWGTYRDVDNIDLLKNRVLGFYEAIYTDTCVKTWLKNHPEMPINHAAHDPESDAIHILNRYTFYHHLLHNTKTKNKPEEQKESRQSSGFLNGFLLSTLVFVIVSLAF